MTARTITVFKPRAHRRGQRRTMAITLPAAGLTEAEPAREQHERISARSKDGNKSRQPRHRIGGDWVR
jgi:hypothetical protein